MKVKFGKRKVKQVTGFIETRIIAYVDVTKIAKNLFDNVKRAIIVQDTYYQFETLEEWKKSQKEAASKIDDKDRKLDIDGQDLIIEFKSGKVIEFHTSEWGRVTSIKEMPEIE